MISPAAVLIGLVNFISMLWVRYFCFEVFFCSFLNNCYLFCVSALLAISKPNAITLRIEFIELSAKRFSFELNAYHTLEYFIIVSIKKRDDDDHNHHNDDNEFQAELILSRVTFCVKSKFLFPHIT